jgi:Na+-transporting NADH:ubiquinone oxidoreductase subunit F
VAVKQDMKIEVPEEVFGVKQWECTVRSTQRGHLHQGTGAEAARRRERRLPRRRLHPDRGPPHHVKYKDFDIEEEYRGDWDASTSGS